MDLVDKQHVVGFEIREQGGEIAGALQHRTRSLAKVDAELVRDDVRKRRLAESRRTEQEHVIERLLALFCGLDKNRKLAADFLLANIFVERARPQRAVEH